VPLIYETGSHDKYDKVIVTICPPEMQIARLVARGLSEASARQRLAAQLPTSEKAARAHYVIRTDGTFEETNDQVGHVLQAIRSQAPS
jgi:dephospho-CoA kinase